MSMSNTIQFPKTGKAPPPPMPQEELPWHIHEARWILGKVQKFRLNILTKWEVAFVNSMATWEGYVSIRQHRVLRKIGDKVEKMLHRLGGPPGPDAA
jgi:hypothetical protein